MNKAYYDNWREEKRSVYLYDIMATHENNVLHKKLFLNLKEAAEKQAMLWEQKIVALNEPVPVFIPDLRSRFIGRLVHIFGIENMHGILSAMKIRGMSIFNRFHTEHKHTSVTAANNIRAAIFGVTDGLISNLSLILGIVGANASHHYIILTGVAGLLAGASSMGAGEYISVRSQRELFERQIAIEKEELATYPEEEEEELRMIYEARGIPTLEAAHLAKIMINNPETGLATLAREELGLDPDDLVSPIGAMLSSFFSFGLGALIPLLPFLLSTHRYTLFFSIGATAFTLFFIGALLSLYTNRNPILLGLRMLFTGAIAGCITFGIGYWLGVG